MYIAFVVRLPTGAPVRVAGDKPGTTKPSSATRAFVRFALANFIWVAAAVALLNSLVPIFAHNEGGVSETAIGLLFLLNSLTIIAFQIPVARRQEGRRRARGLALMSVLFAVAWLTLGLSGVLLQPAAAFAGFAVAILVLSLGECLYDSIQGPLTADLAVERLRGRYMAVNGFSWQLGFILGPVLGAVLMTIEPLAVWIAAAGACLVGGAVALRLEHRLPVPVRASRRSGFVRARRGSTRSRGYSTRATPASMRSSSRRRPRAFIEPSWEISTSVGPTCSAFTCTCPVRNASRLGTTWGSLTWMRMSAAGLTAVRCSGGAGGHLAARGARPPELAAGLLLHEPQPDEVTEVVARRDVLRVGAHAERVHAGVATLIAGMLSRMFCSIDGA